ncbi:c-type cytochrome [Pseudohoeflea coraliihabitans]|uniref:Cytochrome c n=1 Tax=Pseudohoeflea coraliihabitans TaxID=2860393 RepID=A0ABS6WSQ4_9HYPH|nr:cytochrome c [Pseudohoeflea sp. DP4N28-3]MBW3098978.1 cytochrome c [Pseudohoeflea sp. DP4N28-3]
MRKLLLVAFAALVLAGAVVASLAYWPISETVQLDEKTGDAGRGAYLARMAGCIACHTDSANNGAPLAGGVALPTEFGTFYSPNLTTDVEEGIGSWSRKDFARAVRQGVSPEGKPYYPAFPYPFYRRLTDQDIADLWAAFQTVPPVATPSREQEVPFPFSFRDGVKLWRAVFLKPGPFKPEPGKSERWNRGRYIVEGPAHCGACHTPRNFAGARQVELKLHGAEDLPDGDVAPPITAEALLDNGWSRQTLAYALKTGVLPDGDVFGGSMGEVVRDGTAFLTDEDLSAIATYLLDQE